jgi:Tat protein secretion system quality control protein TatD with DNase activity
MLDDNIKAIVHSLLKLPKIKAVGEIWLFNKYLHRGGSEGSQLTNLRWQLETAKLFRPPIGFHCRDMNNLLFSEAT